MIDGIYEFTFRPAADRKPAAALFSTLLGLSAAAIAASAISPLYKGVISLGAIGFLCAAIYVFVRYMSGSYAYVVMYNSGEPLLVITKTVGKRVTTLGDFPIGSIMGIDRISGNSDGKEREKGIKRYNFSPGLRPKNSYKISARGRGIASDIIIEGTEELVARLLEYAAIARAYDAAEN